MHVRVARPPSFRSHVSDAPDPQRQVSLTRLDPHGLPERFVFEPARHVHDDVASWQPSLAGAVDICVTALSQADVAANVILFPDTILRRARLHPVRLIAEPPGRAQ